MKLFLDPYSFKRDGIGRKGLKLGWLIGSVELVIAALLSFGIPQILGRFVLEQAGSEFLSSKDLVIIKVPGVWWVFVIYALANIMIVLVLFAINQFFWTDSRFHELVLSSDTKNKNFLYSERYLGLSIAGFTSLLIITFIFGSLGMEYSNFR